MISGKHVSKIISDEEIPIYGDGMNIRNWLFVEDNCEAIIKIFNKGLVGSKYNVGSEQEISNIELVKMVYEVFNKKEKIKYVNDRFGHDFRYSLNCSKIKNELNWEAKTKIKNYLKKLYTEII